MPHLDRGESWMIVDPRLTDPAVVAVMEQILALARNDWQVDRPIDLRAPLVRRYLSDHRLWLTIPLDAVGDAVRPEVRHRRVAIAAMQLRLRAAAAKVLEHLDALQIESRVLKGLATGELDFPDPLLRQTGDVDLAVPPDRLDDAVAALRDAGYRDREEPFSSHLRYGWTLTAPDGVEIDLHTRLSRRSPLGDQLFRDRGEPLPSLGGVALSAPQRLVHASGHFMISPPGTRRLNGLLDVTRLLDRPGIDLDAARRFAAGLGIESLVGAGLRLEAGLSSRTGVLTELERWEAPDWLERNTRLIPKRRLLLDHLGRFREVPRGQRLRYLPAWLLPSARQRRILLRSTRSGAERVLERRR
ncbi:MAG: nucleotidyltransferase family protein [Actinomycetota bacterium]